MKIANNVTEVRITDVVGSIDPWYGTRDSLGNLINDPFKTPFASGFGASKPVFAAGSPADPAPTKDRSVVKKQPIGVPDDTRRRGWRVVKSILISRYILRTIDPAQA